ncbi:hypothetical protein N015_18300 [Pseudomonas asturiensis]|uniref:Uncharacterized protein n=1 Tax=Pseudomonas asturiensis TaxID=1190415 RepID=A0ABX6HF78_9PSED|nr:hypothetical protein [Pseudomonas asturiensis]QHF04255.1 hypothetical protein N015_18300 [Pseudomonas asturiensis]
MNQFSDAETSRGTRKKTEYLDDQRARLALHIPRQDGGVLQIPLLSDTKATKEQEDIQRNTLIAIVPLARLPGYDAPQQSPRGAFPRRGRIYVFRQNVLWRELQTDGEGQLFEVDLTHWRTIAKGNGDADQRDAVGTKQHAILLPMLLQSRFVADQFMMAYSELPWTWEYIKWLESDPAHVKARCQNIARAWDTAVVGSEHWKTTQANPSLPMTRLKSGLRARDFNIESALEDPLHFTPAFTTFDETALLKRLQTRQNELATHLKQTPPPPLPETESSADLLDAYNLRSNNHLVGVILEDPLFAVRHATAQIRHYSTYLQTLNALVQHRPYGRYAQVLYSVLSGPLSSLKDEIDIPKLHETVFEQDRKNCRTQIVIHIERLISLLDKKIPTFILDWTYRRDEALLEPYSLMTEALGALNQLPTKADAMYTGKESAPLLKAINGLIQRLLQVEHPLGELLLSKTAEHIPDAVKRLMALRDDDHPPKPEAMGLSTLMLSAPLMGEVDWAGAGKGLSYFIGDLLDILGASVVAHISRLSQSASNIKLDRVFAPTFNTLSNLSKKMAGIRLTTFGEALERDYVVIGVQGGGLSNGLTKVERSALTRKNYRYASLHSLSGEKLASTSPKGNQTTKPLARNLSIIAVAKDHPELANYSEFRLAFSEASQKLEGTKVVPTLMLGFAVYNLVIQIEATKNLEENGETLRGYFGVGSAIVDLGAAIGNHSKLIFGTTTEQYLIKPRINVSRISPTWAARLLQQTGSSYLPLLRGIGSAATVIGAAISAWDAYRAFRDGNDSQALAYMSVTVGSGVWGAYALGLTINPYALIIGVVLALGGTVVANLLTDSDAELVTRNGPFGIYFSKTQEEVTGRGNPFKHLKDPLIAYQQLVGIIGKPRVTAMRFVEWREQATTEHLQIIEHADQKRSLPNPPSPYSQTVRPDMQALNNSDWVVLISSPLLAMFGHEEQQLQLFGEEFYSSLDTGQVFAIRQYRRQTMGRPKLSAIALDTSSLMYVLPSFFERPILSIKQRHQYQMTEGVKTFLQVELHSTPNDPPLLLPQPTPAKWMPFTPNNRRPPTTASTGNEPQYWQVEINEITL